MKGYLVKHTYTSKENNETLVFYQTKGGYVRKHEDLFYADGTFKTYLSDEAYKRKWIADKEASKVEDEKIWYTSAEVVEVMF